MQRAIDATGIIRKELGVDCSIFREKDTAQDYDFFYGEDESGHKISVKISHKNRSIEIFYEQEKLVKITKNFDDFYGMTPGNFH